ncbi:hypothetical protein I7I53_00689 [Histoplasma capsulatum var. duboisii H88]|uniref:Uncharacterized protein n=1 Tax=Ajellomyces capsulatus (strain H88) TaxID=544711 RepID=A0A8A1LGB4_AJEC8|nr:hypothetical protein I7I53_00689 [Histoplasma capsulatum var. duboisii H88]
MEHSNTSGHQTRRILLNSFSDLSMSFHPTQLNPRPSYFDIARASLSKSSCTLITCIKYFPTVARGNNLPLKPNTRASESHHHVSRKYQHPPHPSLHRIYTAMQTLQL